MPFRYFTGIIPFRLREQAPSRHFESVCLYSSYVTCDVQIVVSLPQWGLHFWWAQQIISCTSKLYWAYKMAKEFLWSIKMGKFFNNHLNVQIRLFDASNWKKIHIWRIQLKLWIHWHTICNLVDICMMLCNVYWRFMLEFSIIAALSKHKLGKENPLGCTLLIPDELGALNCLEQKLFNRCWCS